MPDSPKTFADPEGRGAPFKEAPEPEDAKIRRGGRVGDARGAAGTPPEEEPATETPAAGAEKAAPPAPPGGKTKGKAAIDPDFREPRLEADGIVSFVMFNRKYHVKTDKPELVFKLADTIREHAQEVRREYGGAPLFDMDILVQASFRVALLLHKARGEKESTEDCLEVREKKIQDLLDFLDKNL
jgi:hypothetical protein